MPRPVKTRINVDDKGRILIPKVIRNMVNLKKGGIVEVEVYGPHRILLTKLGE